MTNKHVTSEHPQLAPIRLSVPGLLDLVLISDPDQIQWLNQHAQVVRKIDPSVSWLHRLLDQRLRDDLGFGGAQLPVFRARDDADRATSQKALDLRLENLRGSPGPERDEIAGYVSGEKDSDEIGVTVQQWCGRLFTQHYRATKETYRAARLLATWPSAPPWVTWGARKSGKLAEAKRVVAAEAKADPHCIHGTTIGMENVARSVRKLRAAARVPEKQTLAPDDILRECLVAPPAVMRTCECEVAVPFLARPLTRQSVVVFLVARAFAVTGDFDVAFLSDSWGACPARRVVPEMLRSVWHTAHHDELEQTRLLSTINTWSRRLQRAVS